MLMRKRGGLLKLRLFGKRRCHKVTEEFKTKGQFYFM